MTASRVRWVIGNWKLNPDFATAKALFQHIHAACTDTHAQPQVMIAPPAPYLAYFGEQCATPSALKVAAQDVSTVTQYGAYTGEYHAELLNSMGIDAVLIGHSERRELFGDDVNQLKQKTQNARAAGLRVIYCVGESLAQREQGRAEAVVIRQIDDVLDLLGAPDWEHFIVAYEPIWAIGTGKTASAQDAQAMHHVIRQHLAQHTPAAAQCAILYGGSVKPENAAALAACPDIDGALVGGASLAVNSFMAIVAAFAD